MCPLQPLNGRERLQCRELVQQADRPSPAPWLRPICKDSDLEEEVIGGKRFLGIGVLIDDRQCPFNVAVFTGSRYQLRKRSSRPVPGSLGGRVGFTSGDDRLELLPRRRQPATPHQKRGQTSGHGRIVRDLGNRLAEILFGIFDPAERFVSMRCDQLSLRYGEVFQGFFERLFGGASLAGGDLLRKQRQPGLRPCGVRFNRLAEDLPGPFGLAAADKHLTKPEQISRGGLRLRGEAPFGRRHCLIEFSGAQFHLDRQPIKSHQPVRPQLGKGLLRFVEPVGEVQERHELADHLRIRRPSLSRLLEAVDGRGNVPAQAGDLGKQLLDLGPAWSDIFGFKKKGFCSNELLVNGWRQGWHRCAGPRWSYQGGLSSLLHAGVENERGGMGDAALRARGAGQPFDLVGSQPRLFNITLFAGQFKQGGTDPQVIRSFFQRRLPESFGVATLSHGPADRSNYRQHPARLHRRQGIGLCFNLAEMRGGFVGGFTCRQLRLNQEHGRIGCQFGRGLVYEAAGGGGAVLPQGEQHQCGQRLGNGGVGIHSLLQQRHRRRGVALANEDVATQQGHLRIRDRGRLLHRVKQLIDLRPVAFGGWALHLFYGAEL